VHRDVHGDVGVGDVHLDVQVGDVLQCGSVICHFLS
jgi:hypothetical protein